jgi:hypothetical protein
MLLLLQVTKPPPVGSCVTSLAIDITPTPRKAAKGTVITWNVTLTPTNGSVSDVNVTNPIPSTLSTPNLIRPPTGGSCSLIAVNVQSVLQCSFASIGSVVRL